ncbi:hypothetical protein LBMAG53_17080 [Planctomycetota bacterium]|nr:hypothetical protein LBMAG53_17080 [Planctomycetota bacterium]
MQEFTELLRDDQLAALDATLPPLIGSYAPRVLAAGKLTGPEMVLADDRPPFRHRWRLIEVQEGTITIIRRVGGSAVLRPEGIALIEPGTVDSIVFSPGSLILHLLFDVEAEPCRPIAGALLPLDPARRQPGARATWGIDLPATLPASAHAGARLLLRRAYDATAGLALRLQADALLATWLAELVTTVVHGRPLTGLDLALHHLRAHLNRPMSIDLMVLWSGLDARRFREAVQERFGCQPADLVRKMRMTLARRLLSEGQPAVSDVARACGYTDSAAFARAFRKEFGCSPSAWTPP